MAEFDSRLLGFGDRLKQLRNERDMSLDMVVFDIWGKFKVRITKSHLSRWENGKNLPSIDNAALLAMYYNVSLDYLLGLTEIKTPTNLLARKSEKR